ncbi:MAG: thiamine pyrophosphate-binding protein [Sulfolobaceae archaeon]|nr:thiamine pyrophosphate-binding protein [Sulfolobaceae archaeon]
MTKVSDIIVETLAKLGVKRIYGIPGDTIAPLLDSIKRSKKLQFIQVRHEEYGAIAAEYEWKVGQQISACTGISGPGAANLVSGLYDAKMDHIPVIAITGMVETKNMWRGYTQELNSLKLFDDVSVFNALLVNPDEAEYLIYKAYKFAITEKGVSHIAVPLDVFIAETEEKRDIGYINAEIYNENDIECSINVDKALEYINNSSKPLILIGGGAKGEGLNIVELAHKINAPILYSLNGKGIISEDEELLIGGIGLMGNYASFYALSNADLILTLGSSLPFRELFPNDATVISVDVNPLNLNDKFKVKLGYATTVRCFLKEILPKLKVKEKGKFLEEVLEYKQRWLKYAGTVENSNTDPIKPQRVIKTLGKLLEDDDILVVDSGSSTAWVTRHLRTNKHVNLVFTSWLGMMGVAIPGVIAASFVSQKGRKVAIAGDGAFSASMMELLTIKKYNLGSKVIVLNNGVYGLVKHEQERLGFEAYGIVLGETNYSRIVEGMGLRGMRVESVNELERKMEEFLNFSGPAVLEILVDPNEIPISWNVIPPT